jgi:hypothetical protein
MGRSAHAKYVRYRSRMLLNFSAQPERNLQLLMSESPCFNPADYTDVWTQVILAIRLSVAQRSRLLWMLIHLRVPLYRNAKRKNVLMGTRRRHRKGSARFGAEYIDLDHLASRFYTALLEPLLAAGYIPGARVWRSYLPYQAAWVLERWTGRRPPLPHRQWEHMMLSIMTVSRTHLCGKGHWTNDLYCEAYCGTQLPVYPEPEGHKLDMFRIYTPPDGWTWQYGLQRALSTHPELLTAGEAIPIHKTRQAWDLFQSAYEARGYELMSTITSTWSAAMLTESRSGDRVWVRRQRYDAMGKRNLAGWSQLVALVTPNITILRELYTWRDGLAAMVRRGDATAIVNVLIPALGKRAPQTLRIAMEVARSLRDDEQRGRLVQAIAKYQLSHGLPHHVGVDGTDSDSDGADGAEANEQEPDEPDEPEADEPEPEEDEGEGPQGLPPPEDNIL